MFASFAVCPGGRVASRRGCVVMSVPWGSASRARRACAVCGAVPWGLLLGRLCRGDLRLGRVACVAWVPLCHGDCCWAGRVGAAVPCGLLLGGLRGWRCAMGIAARRVAWVPLCHADCCWAGRVGTAVPWGLLLGGSRGCRCAMGIAARRVAWVALCHGDCCWAGRVPLCHADCCWARRVSGAVSWGLLTRASSGWRRDFGIADQGLVAVLVRVAAGVLVSQNGSF